MSGSLGDGRRPFSWRAERTAASRPEDPAVLRDRTCAYVFLRASKRAAIALVDGDDCLPAERGVVSLDLVRCASLLLLRTNFSPLLLMCPPFLLLESSGEAKDTSVEECLAWCSSSSGDGDGRDALLVACSASRDGVDSLDDAPDLRPEDPISLTCIARRSES